MGVDTNISSDGLDSGLKTMNGSLEKTLKIVKPLTGGLKKMGIGQLLNSSFPWVFQFFPQGFNTMFQAEEVDMILNLLLTMLLYLLFLFLFYFILFFLSSFFFRPGECKPTLPCMYIPVLHYQMALPLLISNYHLAISIDPLLFLIVYHLSSFHCPIFVKASNYQCCSQCLSWALRNLICIRVSSE